MRGFGAVPRRGAEVGGILLGAAASAGPALRVEDYVLVPIEYKRGPSYRLSDNDVAAFDAAVRQSRNGRILRPIGFFRSHTRDGVGLSEEDLGLLSNYLPEPESIALLIRPFATKPCVAVFISRSREFFRAAHLCSSFPCGAVRWLRVMFRLQNRGRIRRSKPSRRRTSFVTKCTLSAGAGPCYRPPGCWLECCWVTKRRSAYVRSRRLRSTSR